MPTDAKSAAKGPGRILATLIRNPHFWILVALFIALYVIYSWDMIFFNQRWEWLYKLTIFEFRFSLHGSLFAIPIIYAAYVFWWRGALVAWVLSMVVVVPRIFTYRHDPLALFENIFYLLIPLLLVIYFSVERNWRQKERKALAEREAERRSYTLQVLKAQEDERHRIAQELHDDPTQTLLVIANRVQALVSDGLGSDNPQQKKELEWIRDANISVSEELKRICLDLRPSVLDDLGLIAALRWTVEELNHTSPIRASLDISGVEPAIPSEKEVTLFRIVQEALNNVRRHSQATTARVEVQFINDAIKIRIIDDGTGFAMEKISAELRSGGKLGLRGMKERTQLLNGKFEISSEIGRGTIISIEMPA